MREIKGPDEVYGALFDAVQSRHVFADSKTFVDATPKSAVPSILAAFSHVDREDIDAVRAFVSEHFTLPGDGAGEARAKETASVRARIDQLWDVLSRAADEVEPDSSLIALPRPYIVPGGRFREIYYWDSYFTMLGLAESGRFDVIENMVDNFAHLIDEIGFIPNGNRSYFCTRSQPPFFVLMVELLAEVRKDEGIVQKYLPQLEKEYAFWMSGAAALENDRDAVRRVVKVGDGFLNRYWDDSDKPRAESYAEDLEHAAKTKRCGSDYFRDVRAACESGWDFSSRWLEDRHSMESIRATQIVPVDLNALIYNLETTLVRIYGAQNRIADVAVCENRAAIRRELLQNLFFDEASGMFVDLLLPEFSPSGTLSLAAVYPLFFDIATPRQAGRVAQCIQRNFLKAGGWVTSNYDTGQQWDSPNGWAPLQWITFCGLERYGFHEQARIGAERWIDNNVAVYEEHGCLLEKYNVVSSGLAGSGGEYEVQEGFGWTNGVLLGLMQKLGRD